MRPEQAVLQRHLAAENAGDLEGTIATLHPDCVFIDHATGQTWRGRDGAAAHYRQWWASFDLVVQRTGQQRGLWASATTYIAEATWIGTHTGAFLGIQATGRRIDMPFVVMVTFKEELMDSEVFYYDLASLLRQLGVERLPELSRLPHRTATS